jgi:hypothetical protein
MSKSNLFSIDDDVYKIRNDIRKMLAETRFLDPELANAKYSVRYYYMTEEEFQKLKPYTFTVFVGNLEDDQCEGFCYDIVRIHSEGYLQLDLEIPTLPICLSPERWGYLVKKYPNMFFYSKEEGKLSYPITKTELQTILSGVIAKGTPVICSFDKGCIPVTISQLDAVHGQLLKLFDQNEKHRHGPKDVLKTEKKGLDDKGWSLPVENKLSDQEIDKKVDKVIEEVRKQLSEMSLLIPAIDTKLSSQEERVWIEGILKSSTEVEQVAGMIIDEVLMSVLENKSQLN